MSWQDELDEIRRREALARQMGGAEKVKRQRDGGKLTVRERIAAVLDPDSFHETGALTAYAEYDAQGKLTGYTPANLVTGRGRIDGRAVVVCGDDFTVRGGANDAGIHEKLVHAERMAHDLRLPIVRLVDGTGGGGSVKTIEQTGRSYIPRMPVWDLVVRNMSQVPVVSLALGSVAGMGSARVAASHYSLMVKESSQLFVAGPPVVARVGEVRGKNELGGSHIHARNGVVDDECESEAEAFVRARRFLSYLPSSVHELPPQAAVEDDPRRRDEWLIHAVPRDPRKVYKMRDIVAALVDRDSFHETGRLWGRSIITGLARLNGWPVAVVASDPYIYGGAWSAQSSEKLTRFIDLAEVFHLPVVHLVDIPGFLIGLEAEKAATMRYGVRALAAVYQASVPWCTVIVRKAFGVAGAAHQSSARFAMRYAWPSAEWGSLPIAGGLEAAYKADLEAAPDRAARMAEIEARLVSLSSPVRSAEAFLIEEIIDPRDTRPLLCEFADLAAPLRTPGTRAFGIRP